MLRVVQQTCKSEKQMNRKSLWAQPVRTKKGWRLILCCLFRHAEASARCYVKLYNKWAWALWTGWPHKPGRVTRSPTCGSNKVTPPSARHVGDTAFQWSSLKLKNKSNKHCPSLKGGPRNRPRQRTPAVNSIYLSTFNIIWFFFFSVAYSTQHAEKWRNPPPPKCLIILNSVCSSSQ